MHAEGLEVQGVWAHSVHVSVSVGTKCAFGVYRGGSPLSGEVTALPPESLAELLQLTCPFEWVGLGP